jgi:hypothetical protein
MRRNLFSKRRAIQSWDTYNTEAKVSQSAENYPSCLQFYQMKEQGTITSISDAIMGSQYIQGATVAAEPFAIKYLGNTVTEQTLNPPNILGGYVLGIFAFHAKGAVKGTMGFGDLTEGRNGGWCGNWHDTGVAGWGIGTGTWWDDYALQEDFQLTCDTPVGSTTVPVPSVIAVIGNAVWPTPASADGYVYWSRAGLTPTRHVLNDARGEMTGLTWHSDYNMTIARSTMGSMALFHLAEMPSENEMYSIIEWTRHHHMDLGNKVICPYFLGLERG